MGMATPPGSRVIASPAKGTLSWPEIPSWLEESAPVALDSLCDAAEERGSYKPSESMNKYKLADALDW